MRTFAWLGEVLNSANNAGTRFVGSKNIEPVRGKVVVLLHGLGATRFAMEGLGKYLETEGGYSIVNVTYASTRADLQRDAAQLAGEGARRLEQCRRNQLCGP